MTKLSFSKNELVRLAVAANPSTPVADLQRMLNRGRDVRATVLSNPSLPEADMLTVAARPRTGDLTALAANPAVTEDVIAKALASADDVARQTLLAHPKAPADATYIPDASPRATPVRDRSPSEVLNDANATAGELFALAYLRDDRIRAQVAAHPNTPLRVLEGYLRLDHWTLLRTLSNPSLPERAIVDRFNRPIFDVRAALEVAAKRPQMTERFARFVLDSWHDQGGFRMIQRVPAALAANPATPPSVLSDLAMSGDPDVLRALSMNPAALPVAS